MVNFGAMIQERWQKGHFLCVGLDSDYTKLPTKFNGKPIVGALFEFNREIVEATAEFCCAFKPNIAFYEGYGLAGLEALIKTNCFIRDQFPEIPIILDAKRADIGNTNQGYVKAAFEVFQAQAITVQPYLGQEALKPFLDQKDYGIIVLCHTSNPGASEFQELQIGGRELYKVVAEKVSREWNSNQNCSLVLGATYPKQLAEVREIVGEMPFLIPGIGAQGGDLEETVKNGLNKTGTGIIINASRSIIYASMDEHFAQAAAMEAAKIDREIRTIITHVKIKK